MRQFEITINERKFHVLLQEPSYSRNQRGQAMLKHGLFGIWEVNQASKDKEWVPYPVPKEHIEGLITRINRHALDESAALTKAYFECLNKKILSPQKNDECFARASRRLKCSRLILGAYDSMKEGKTLWIDTPSHFDIGGRK